MADVTNFYEEILKLARVIANGSGSSSSTTVNTTIGSGTGGNDPSLSPAGQSVISSWRSRTAQPVTVDASTGRRAWLVPAGREWQLMALSATLASSATVGNRQVEVHINPGENNLELFRYRYPAAAQAANLTYAYNFSMGGPMLQTALNNYLSAPLAPLILGGLSTIVLWDKAQIAPSTDTFSNINLLIAERVVA